MHAARSTQSCLHSEREMALEPTEESGWKTSPQAFSAWFTAQTTGVGPTMFAGVLVVGLAVVIARVVLVAVAGLSVWRRANTCVHIATEPRQY